MSQGVELEGPENSFLSSLEYSGVSCLHCSKYFMSLLGVVWPLCSPLILSGLLPQWFHAPTHGWLQRSCPSRLSWLLPLLLRLCWDQRGLPGAWAPCLLLGLLPLHSGMFWVREGP